jgi:hypothetical protein
MEIVLHNDVFFNLTLSWGKAYTGMILSNRRQQTVQGHEFLKK